MGVGIMGVGIIGVGIMGVGIMGVGIMGIGIMGVGIIGINVLVVSLYRKYHDLAPTSSSSIHKLCNTRAASAITLTVYVLRIYATTPITFF